MNFYLPPQGVRVWFVDTPNNQIEPGLHEPCGNPPKTPWKVRDA